MIYTPPAYFNGTATFTYTIIDDGVPALTGVGTVTVTVTAVNDPPIPQPDTGTTNEDTPKAFTALQLLANDAPGPAAPPGTVDNESGQTLTLASVSPTSAQGGTVTFSSGIVTYTPRPNFNGIDTFTYRVMDNGLTNGVNDHREATGTVTVTVIAVNDGPTISAPTNISVNEDQWGPIPGITVTDIDVGETPPPGGRLEVELRVNNGVLTVAGNVPGGLTAPDITFNGTALVTLSGTPEQINATLSATNGLRYLSNLNFNGSDRLVITADDGGQTGIPNPASPSRVTRTVTVNVAAINDPPEVALPGMLTLDEDTSAYLGAITVTDVDANETPGATLRVTLTVDHGTLLVSTAISGGVTSGNVSANNTASVTLVGTLAALNATLTHPAGVLYRPVKDYNGTDTVTVHVNDQGNTGWPGPQATTGTFTITVLPVNDPPVAINDPGPGDPELVVDENTVLVVAGRGVLDNDYDVDGDQLSVVIDGVTPSDGKYQITSARGAPIVIAQDGTFTFDPTGVSVFQQLTTGQSLADTFTYRAFDGELVSNLATVTITVTGINDPPVVVPPSYTTPDSTVLRSFQNPAVPHLLTNSYDPEGQPISVLVASSDSVSKLGAAVTIQTNGEFVYDPRTSPALVAMRPGDPPVTDTFAVVVADSQGLWTKATVTVTVTGENTPPIAGPDQYSTMENVVLVVAAPGVLANDTDPDGDSDNLAVTAGTITSLYGATIQMQANGSFTYDPRESQTLRALQTGQNLSDTFSYVVTDEGGRTAQGTVTVVVGGITGPMYQNQANPLDVNGDGTVSPIDALILINYINAFGQGPIPTGRPRPPYLDVNGDGNATAEDVLLVVNRLNAVASGEGESGVQVVYGGMSEISVSHDSAPLGGDSGNPLTDLAARSGELAMGGRGDSTSEDDDLTPWARDTAAGTVSRTSVPRRSVFDAWDADDDELEDALTAISRQADDVERETATDALLGALFG